MKINFHIIKNDFHNHIINHQNICKLSHVLHSNIHGHGVACREPNIAFSVDSPDRNHMSNLVFPNQAPNWENLQDRETHNYGAVSRA